MSDWRNEFAGLLVDIAQHSLHREDGVARVRLELDRVFDVLEKIAGPPDDESAAVRTLRGHVTAAELRAAQHAHDYTMEHEGAAGPAPDYL